MPYTASRTALHWCRAAAAAPLLAALLVTSGPALADHEQRILGGFDRLDLRTAARVLIRQGDRDVVQIDADAALLPRIETRVDNDTLHLQDGAGAETGPAQVVITLRQLRGLTASGPTQVSVQGLQGRELSITGGGTSSMSLRQVDVGRLRVALGGGSQLQVSGATRELTAQLGGQAGLEAGALDADAAMVQGGGHARATVCVRSSLNVAIAGSSSVSYYGQVKPTVAIGGSAVLRPLGPMPAPAPPTAKPG